MKHNYIDEKGNYHNELNFTLAQIYDSGVDFGRSVAKADFKAELEEIKEEMQDYGCSFIIAKRIDLASAISNCIRMVDKHIKEIEE